LPLLMSEMLWMSSSNRRQRLVVWSTSSGMIKKCTLWPLQMARHSTAMPFQSFNYHTEGFPFDPSEGCLHEMQTLHNIWR